MRHAFASAVACGDENRALQLFEQEKLNMDDLIKSGFLVLHHANGTSHPSLLEFLLEHCSLLEVQNSHGQTALHVAVRSCDNVKALKLLKKGASPGITDNSGYTPLHTVSMRPHLFSPELLQLLISNTPDYNIRDKSGATALHYLATNDYALSKTLLEQGADPNIQDNDGDTPLHRAAAIWGKDKAIQQLQLLESYGGDCDKRNTADISPRHKLLEKHDLHY